MLSTTWRPLALLECILWRKGLNGVLLMLAPHNRLPVAEQDATQSFLFGDKCSTPAMPRVRGGIMCVCGGNMQHLVLNQLYDSLTPTGGLRVWQPANRVQKSCLRCVMFSRLLGVCECVLCLCAASMLCKQISTECILQQSKRQGGPGWSAEFRWLLLALPHAGLGVCVCVRVFISLTFPPSFTHTLTLTLLSLSADVRFSV